MEPTWVMIGHDEWYHYCICPRCRNKDAGELLAQDVNCLHDHLQSRGIKCMMWCDLLLDSTKLKNKTTNDYVMGPVVYGAAERVFVDDGGGKYVRKSTAGAIPHIPDDILMADWQYFMSPDTEAFMGKHGKQVVFGNFNRKFFDQHPERLASPNVKGGIYSTWHENSQMAMAVENWPQKAMIISDMFWASQWRKGELDRRRDLYDAFWSATRSRLYDSTRRLVTREAGTKFRTLSVDLAKAQIAGSAGDFAAPALGINKIDGPVPVKAARRPLVIDGRTDCRITVPIGKQLKGIAFLLRWLPGKTEINDTPIWDWPHYEDFYLSREVGRCRVFANIIPTSPIRREVSGQFNFLLGAHVGIDNGLAGMADHIKLPGGQSAYIYEWRNHNPDFYRIERLVLESGRSELDGKLVVDGMTLIL